MIQMTIRRIRNDVHELALPYVDDTSEESIFKFNTFLHMRVLFDSKHEVTNIIFEKENETNFYGQLSKYNCFTSFFKNGIIVEKVVNPQYTMTIMNYLSDWMFDRFDEDDEEILLYRFEKTMLHEFAHLKSWKHDKKFKKVLRRYMTKWLAYKLKVSQLEIRRDFGFILNEYVNISTNGYKTKLKFRF